MKGGAMAPHNTFLDNILRRSNELRKYTCNFDVNLWIPPAWLNVESMVCSSVLCSTFSIKAIYQCCDSFLKPFLPYLSWCANAFFLMTRFHNYCSRYLHYPSSWFFSCWLRDWFMYRTYKGLRTLYKLNWGIQDNVLAAVNRPYFLFTMKTIMI